MRQFLVSLCGLIPEAVEDAEKILASPEERRNDMVYTDIVLRHLVDRAKEYDHANVQRARVLWFRYVSVAPYRNTGRKTVVQVDMDRHAPRRRTGVVERMLLRAARYAVVTAEQ